MKEEDLTVQLKRLLSCYSKKSNARSRNKIYLGLIVAPKLGLTKLYLEPKRRAIRALIPTLIPTPISARIPVKIRPEIRTKATNDKRVKPLEKEASTVAFAT
jgi:hypothetical protein